MPKMSHTRGSQSTVVTSTRPVTAAFVWSVTNTVSIKVKYDCLYLKNNGVYGVAASPKLTMWRDPIGTIKQSDATLNFKIGDETLDAFHQDVVSVPGFNYSCQVQYDFVCPAG